jgi:hypothetical protein
VTYTFLSWNSGEVNEVLRNAENAIDKPDRYFAFKTLLLSSPEVDKTGIYRNYQQASANINVGTQYVGLLHINWKN